MLETKVDERKWTETVKNTILPKQMIKSSVHQGGSAELWIILLGLFCVNYVFHFKHVDQIHY